MHTLPDTKPRGERVSPSEAVVVGDAYYFASAAGEALVLLCVAVVSFFFDTAHT